MKRIRKAFCIIIGVLLIWNHLPYHYNNERTAVYVTKHKADESRRMCAWYVIKAMWRGGCPIGLVPAYAYDKMTSDPALEKNDDWTDDQFVDVEGHVVDADVSTDTAETIGSETDVATE